MFRKTQFLICSLSIVLIKYKAKQYLTLHKYSDALRINFISVYDAYIPDSNYT